MGKPGKTGAEPLPEPLVPTEINLADFAYMPMYVELLRRSRTWLYCKRYPNCAFFVLNLWMRAWREHPSASIENDDDVLRDAADAPRKEWNKHREEILRTWLVCNDGRIYHPVLAAKALDVWDKKDAYRNRLAAAREAKQLKRWQHNDREPIEPITEPVTESIKEPVTDNLLQPQLQGLSQGLSASLSVSRSVSVSRSKEVQHQVQGRRASRSADLEPPAWVPADAWARYVEMRRTSKKKITLDAGAFKVAVAKLEKLKQAGEALTEVLDQSTLHGWPGLYAVHPEGLGGGNGRVSSKRQALEQRNKQVSQGWKPRELREGKDAK